MGEANILTYTTEDGQTKVEVFFDNDTVWLSWIRWKDLFSADAILYICVWRIAWIEKVFINSGY